MNDTLRFWFSPHGRIGRIQWWLGHLVAIIAGWGLGAFALGSLVAGLETGNTALTVVGIVLIPVAPLAIWSYIALSTKRLHDTDNSGWTMLLVLVPFIGSLILLCMLGFKAGTPRSNHYGRIPH